MLTVQHFKTAIVPGLKDRLWEQITHTNSNVLYARRRTRTIKPSVYSVSNSLTGYSKHFVHTNLFDSTLVP